MANTSAATAALGALGDGTRRAIFERLARGPLAVGALAAGLPVTRPAVSQHLKVMKDAGLVIDQARGTRRVYRLDPRGIGALRDWLEDFWAGGLAAFEDYVDDNNSEETDHDDRAD
ncbi:MAG: winged helix-turn-helix transcriptional regulator [Caulobacteraceae bacterium]|nr:winged helix-turn-helix transcriptional regulator [Caulobacteraceae bacterium]